MVRSRTILNPEFKTSVLKFFFRYRKDFSRQVKDTIKGRKVEKVKDFSRQVNDTLLEILLTRKLKASLIHGWAKTFQI